MRKLILRMEVSLDAVAAREKGAVDAVNYSDEGSWSDVFETLKSVDAMLIGAGAHRDYLAYWNATLTNPKASANERRYAEIAARTPHFVVSRTLRSVEWPNASVLPGGVEGIAELKRKPGRDIILWGGPTVASAAIEAGLVDEYHLVMQPVVGGHGKKLFSNLESVRRLRHLDTKSYPSGLVEVKYASA